MEGGWAVGSFLLRSINGALIRECINNFGIINSRIILREGSWPATLPAALPRKHEVRSVSNTTSPRRRLARVRRELRIHKRTLGNRTIPSSTAKETCAPARATITARLDDFSKRVTIIPFAVARSQEFEARFQRCALQQRALKIFKRTRLMRVSLY